RKHNRLSVKPVLSFDIMYIKTELGFGLYICNKGIGPAIIIDFKIFIDNAEIIAKRMDLWKEALKILEINYSFVIQHMFDDDTPLSAGERLPLLTVDDDIKEEHEKLFREALRKINIKIKYESIYKEKFIVWLKSNS
ncbi:hypothetical protein MUP95_03535, partial [bacterium]|nr:hypothetical protein [bacterium]